MYFVGHIEANENSAFELRDVIPEIEAYENSAFELKDFIPEISSRIENVTGILPIKCGTSVGLKGFRGIPVKETSKDFPMLFNSPGWRNSPRKYKKKVK